MSVLVKGMKMPRCCLDCPLYDCYNYHCQMYAFGIPARYNRDGSIRPEWCELVELPEKYGDLIDRTTLLKEFELAQKSADMHGREFANAFYSSGNEISTEWWAVEELVENAIAVIEAEGEG